MKKIKDSNNISVSVIIWNLLSIIWINLITVLLLISKDIIYAVLYLITQVEHLGLPGVRYLRPLGYIFLMWSIN